MAGGARLGPSLGGAAIVLAMADMIDVLAKVEPLLNRDIEKRRLVYVYQTLIATPEHAGLGIGDVDDAKLARNVTTIAESYELAKPPAPAPSTKAGVLKAGSSLQWPRHLTLKPSSASV